MLERAGMLFRIAFRNLFRSRINLLIGAVILGGTVLVVVGGALLNSVISSMSRSIIGSVAGHIQVYSAASKEEFAIWPMGGNDPDLSPMVDWERKQRLLASVPNVKAVIPMGINAALITSGNTVDLTLEELRSVVREEKEHGVTPELEARRASLKEHVRQIVRVLQSDLVRVEDINTPNAVDPEDRNAIQRASSDDFWKGFDRDPYEALEFLENRIAPLLSDADLVPLRYVGTDLDAFQKNFDRMEIVDGQPVPPGHRGFLMSKFVYEDRLKLRTARRLDKIKDALDLKGSIARDETLQRYVRENRTQTREILLQLDRLKTEKAVALLQRTLGSSEKDLDKLLNAFFDTDDRNFHDRYQVFYRDLAPLLQLYRLKVGDVLTITAFTRSGYVQSLNLKVWGTFQFRGLEKSALSGNINLMDIVSFRELYGYLSADRKAEIEAIKKEGGVQEIDRGKAEDELFGQPGRHVVAEATPGIIDEKERFKGTGAALRREDLVRRVYDPSEIGHGVVLDAAIILKDPRHLQRTLADIRALSDREHLGLRAVSWREAAGFLGQFILLATVVLLLAVAIIFIVAMVIINNSVMMATLQRTAEVGTMRAIGAQRGLILWMVLVETVTLGLIFGSAGAALGAGAIALLHWWGIPAGNETLYFFFSGPRLFPTLSPWNIVIALVVVVLVTVLSTLYPAFLATRVPPVRAMQSDE
ncbi:MAG TPA: FtsX-like permease family protein [Myxococcaceae bacterium]|nr:FtsX-like permease family protein [Myxococcaceae bacterium]